MKKFTLLLLLPAFLIGCTIQKRLYNPGYSITWNKRIKSDKSDVDMQVKNAVIESEPIMKELDTVQPDPLQNEIILDDTLKKCDNIVFNDGNEVNGIVTEVTETELKYRSCDNPTGPIYTITKSKVLMVKYSNGTKEVFKKEDPVKPPMNIDEKKKKKIEPFSLTGFIVGLVNLPLTFLLAPYSGFILGGLCILYGIIGILRISLKKDKFRGAGFAFVSLLLGVISIALTLIFFVV